MNNPWNSIPSPKANLNVLRVDETSSVDAFWAVGPEGEYLFLAEGLTVETGVEMPAFDAIRITVGADRGGSGKCRLLLRLLDADEWELFFALCTDLVRALAASGPETGLSAVAARLVQWVSFLRSGRERVLSREAIRGLFGELTLLETRLAPVFGWGAAVEGWGGPLGMPQDFAVGGMAIETKAKLANARREVQISSEDQLVSKAGELFLHILTLTVAGGEDEKGISLAERVGRVRAAVAGDRRTADSLEDRLLAVGYADSSAYERERFLVTEEATYRVANGFPRIVPEGLPHGIHRVSYGLDLTACEPFKVANEGWPGKG